MNNATKPAILLLLATFVVSVYAQEASEEDHPSALSFREQLSNVKDIVARGLSEIGKPARSNPFNIGTEEYAICVMRFENDRMTEMDTAVKGMVWGGFQKGMSLDAIIASTQGRLSWSEWPTRFAEDDIPGVRGVTDVAMSDEEWLTEDNEVVVLYQTYVCASGPRVHVFQNSFRTVRKVSMSSTINVRECPSLYAVIVSSDGTVHAGNLYREHFFSPRGNSHLGVTPRVMGFLSIDAQSIPGIMVSCGPSGRVMNFDISHYTWNEQYKLWEGTGLWSSERVLTYSYDGNSTDFTYSQCIEKPPEGPNAYGCMQTVNLREYYLEHRDQIEASRRQNARIGSTLTPPKEMYANQPEGPVESQK